MSRRRRAAAPAPAGPGLYDIPTAVKNEPLRCHWATDTNPDTGEEVLVFVPGCDSMLLDPEHQTCVCDNLAHRLALQVDQRRDCDREISRQRAALRAWVKAGAAAYTALTGKHLHGSYVHPQELVRAARRPAS